MKKIIDYINESKGADIFDRDGSHGKYKDPLIKKNETRLDRVCDIYIKKTRKLLDEIRDESKIFDTFDKIYQVEQAVYSSSVIIRAYSDSFYPYVVDRAGCHFFFIKKDDIPSKSVENYIYKFLQNDKRLLKFVDKDKDKSKNNETSRFVVSTEYCYDEDAVRVGVFLWKFPLSYKGFLKFYKYLEENKNDIIYALKKYVEMYNYLKKHDAKVYLPEIPSYIDKV